MVKLSLTFFFFNDIWPPSPSCGVSSCSHYHQTDNNYWFSALYSYHQKFTAKAYSYPVSAHYSLKDQYICRINLIIFNHKKFIIIWLFRPNPLWHCTSFIETPCLQISSPGVMWGVWGLTCFCPAENGGTSFYPPQGPSIGASDPWWWWCSLLTFPTRTIQRWSWGNKGNRYHHCFLWFWIRFCHCILHHDNPTLNSKFV